MTYQLDLTQNLVLTTEGEAAAVSSEDIPASADVEISATGNLVFRVTEGPQPDTYNIAIEGEFDEVAVEGTADGEQVDDVDQLSQLGGINPVSTVIVVDRYGRVVHEDEEESTGGDPLGSSGLPLAGLTGDLTQLMGPVLPEDPVRSGDRWTHTFSDPTLADEPVETTAVGVLLGAEMVDGAEALVIETQTETEAGEVNLSEFFSQFLLAFEDDASSEGLGEDLEQLVFRIVVDPSSSEGTAWFDASQGLVLRSTTSGSSNIRMEVSLPDEETGDYQDFNMALETEQSLEYNLVPSG